MHYGIAFLPFNIGWPEAIVLAVLAILLFGRRLPQVGRSLGRGLVEFKKGLKGVQEEIEKAGQEENDAAKKENDGDDDSSAYDKSESPRPHDCN